jgi:methyl-accepting chemotaxis protein
MGEKFQPKRQGFSAKLLIRGPISRLKVFYQILVIIAIMIAFFIIQGSTSVYVTDTIQNYSLNNIKSTNDRFNHITTIKTYIELIEKEYIKALTGRGRIEFLINEGDTQGLPRINSEMVQAVKSLSEVAPEECQQILASINNIQQIIRQEVSEDNYVALKKELSSIYTLTDAVNTKSIDASYQSITQSSNFVLTSKIATIIIMILCAIISIFLGLVMSSTISKPLEKIESAVKSLAEGNLTQKISISGCPEVTGVANGLNNAIASLQQLVTQIHQESDTLFTASKELKAATSDTGESMNQVANTMADLAKASADQSAQVNNAVEIIHLLSDLVNKVTYDTSDIANASKNVSESAEAGKIASSDVSNEMNELYSSTLQVAEVVKNLSETSGEISEITNLIQGIAEQTNLLALNASIEAARAGEHGKGFAVVASETGKLADQSIQSANLIANLLTNMNARIEQAVAIMEKNTQRAETGKNLAAKAMITFEEIFQSLNATLVQIGIIANSAGRMSESNTKVTDAIEAIAAISEETSASTEEVTATAEEQSAAVQQVNALAENLSLIADNLNQSVAFFKL